MTGRRLGLLMAAIAVVASACAAPACACAPPLLTVYAASSLRDAMDQIAEAYPRNLAARINFSTGSSAALRTQIEQGAHADLFLSADANSPQALVDAGATHGAPVPFTSNRLAVVVPRGNPAGIASWVDLARGGVRVIAAGEGVPITSYAEMLVTNLAAQAGATPDFVSAYHGNIVSREESVSAVVSKIALGEGDAAIVYTTDARSADVETIEVPADANVIATYVGVVLRRTHHPVASSRLLEWIRGPEGQAILLGLGFSPAP